MAAESQTQASSSSRRNFAPMPLAVLVSDASPFAKLLILALYHHDWDGLKAWPGKTRLAQIMSCSTRTVQHAIGECIERKWLHVVRNAGQKNVYEIHVPDMQTREFDEILYKRNLDKKPSKTTINLKLAPPLDPGTTCRTTPAPRAVLPRHHVPQNESNITESNITTPSAAQKPAAGGAKKHPDQDRLWTGLQAAFKKKFPTLPPAAWPTMRAFHQVLDTELKRLGVSEILRRWQNNLSSDYGSTTSLRVFFSDTDKWIESKKKQIYSGPNSRYVPENEERMAAAQSRREIQALLKQQGAL